MNPKVCSVSSTRIDSSAKRQASWWQLLHLFTHSRQEKQSENYIPLPKLQSFCWFNAQASPRKHSVGLFCADTLCLYLQRNNLKIIPVFGLCLQVSELDWKSRIRSDEGKTSRATDLDMEKSYYGSQQQLQRWTEGRWFKAVCSSSAIPPTF